MVRTPCLKESERELLLAGMEQLHKRGLMAESRWFGWALNSVRCPDRPLAQPDERHAQPS